MLHCCYTLAEKALVDQSSGLGCAVSRRARHAASKALQSQNMLVFQVVASVGVLRKPDIMGCMMYVWRPANRLDFRFPLPDGFAGRPFLSPPFA